MTTATRFADSAEATAFMYQLQAMLADARLVNWVESTDDNYGTSALAELMEARACYEAALAQVESAC